MAHINIHDLTLCSQKDQHCWQEDMALPYIVRTSSCIGLGGRHCTSVQRLAQLRTCAELLVRMILSFGCLFGYLFLTKTVGRTHVHMQRTEWRSRPGNAVCCCDIVDAMRG